MELLDLYDELCAVDQKLGWDVVDGRDNALLQARAAEDDNVGLLLSRRDEIVRRIRIIESEDAEQVAARDMRDADWLDGQYEDACERLAGRGDPDEECDCEDADELDRDRILEQQEREDFAQDDDPRDWETPLGEELDGGSDF